MQSSPLRVAIVADHAFFRDGLKSLLKFQPELTVVAEANRADAIIPILATTPCDVVLLDSHMDGQALASIPRLTEYARAVVLTASEHVGDALAAFRAGAHAVIFKRFAIETLMQALKAVARGDVWMPQSLQASIVASLRESPSPRTTARVTPRERDIIRCVALGLRNSEVAASLSISEQTVKTHLNNIFQKIGVRDRVELALYAARVGIIAIHEQLVAAAIPRKL